MHHHSLTLGIHEIHLCKQALDCSLSFAHESHLFFLYWQSWFFSQAIATLPNLFPSDIHVTSVSSHSAQNTKVVFCQIQLDTLAFKRINKQKSIPKIITWFIAVTLPRQVVSQNYFMQNCNLQLITGKQTGFLKCHFILCFC